MTAPFHDTLVALLPDLYRFTFCVTANHDDALEQLRGICEHLASERTQLEGESPHKMAIFGSAARWLEANLGRRATLSFGDLDAVLRSDITRPIDAAMLARDGIEPDTHVLLWQLKRTCLTSALCCLPPAVRISFVLTDILGFAPDHAASMLKIKESAYRVRLARGRKKIEDYITPRCSHVDRQNPCDCPGRLMIAVDSGFVRSPPHTLDIPHEPHDAQPPRRDVPSLYRALPNVVLDPTTATSFEATLRGDSGDD
jgi:RNA polymerase sigma-70 factor (ECF subfamily)